MSDSRLSRQFWIRAPGEGEIRERTLPPLRSGELRARSLFSGISRGTEMLVFRGRVPESQYAAMRAPFQEGDFPAPVKYGYAAVGEVVEGAEEWLGRRVFCLHPHQDSWVVPEDAVVPLPEGLPARRAVLAANLETAVNALWDARPSVGDHIVVVGAGVVGLLVGWLCGRIPGTRVVAVDLLPERESVATALGMGFASEIPGGGDADLVVHASGQPAGARAALSAAGAEATVLELSWFGDRPVELPLGEAFHSRRLTLRSSQVGRVPPERAVRWSRRRRLQLALELLADPVLDRLITGETPFEELPGLMARLAHEPDGTLCHCIRYGEDELV